MAAIDVKTLLMHYQDVFLILDRFDHADFGISGVAPSGPCQIEHKTMEEAFTTLEKMVAAWNGGSAGLLSCADAYCIQEAIDSVNLTFNEMELYPSVAEKAANLLYFMVKDHHFSDGNKRIGALATIMLLASFGMKTAIAPDMLAALTILVAESRPSSKDDVISLITSLLARDNRQFASTQMHQ